MSSSICFLSLNRTFSRLMHFDLLTKEIPSHNHSFGIKHTEGKENKCFLFFNFTEKVDFDREFLDFRPYREFQNSERKMQNLTYLLK